MTDRPIIFSGPMVRALLAGQKTQTRRLLRIAKHREFSEFGPSDTPGYDWHFRDAQKRWHDLRHAELLVRLPWQAGDRLYVREALAWNREGDNRFFYRADNADVPPDVIPAGFRITNTHAPSMHMPRWASRLTLGTTEVRVQRLLDLSEEDARAEGIHITRVPDKDGHRHFGVQGLDFTQPTAKRAFAALWEHINGERTATADPWVVALTFTVERRNIDATALAAA